VDGVAAGDVLGALQVAEFVEVSLPGQAFLQRGAAFGGLTALGRDGAGEAAQMSSRIVGVGSNPVVNCVSWASICSACAIGWSQERSARRVAQ
jgi:hypothetical protein